MLVLPILCCLGGTLALAPARGYAPPALKSRPSSATARVQRADTAGKATAGASRSVALFHKSRFKVATPNERRQFHAELARHGWPVGSPAPVPTAYAMAGGGVRGEDYRAATLYGDIDGDRQPEWVVGYYFPPRPRSVIDPSDPMPPVAPPGGADFAARHDERARIVVFKRDGSGLWRFHWRSSGLGTEFRAPEYNLREVEKGLDRIENLRLPLSLVDLDGDRRLDIAYHGWSVAPEVGSLPGVYRWDGDRFISVAPQADRFSLLDLNGDGKLEVVTGSRYIGYGMGDDDVPRVWRWKGARYQEASSEFPGFYADLVQRYRTYVRAKEQKGEVIPRDIWQRAIQKASSLSGRLVPTTSSFRVL